VAGTTFQDVAAVYIEANDLGWWIVVPK